MYDVSILSKTNPARWRGWVRRWVRPVSASKVAVDGLSMEKATCISFSKTASSRERPLKKLESKSSAFAKSSSKSCGKMFPVSLARSRDAWRTAGVNIEVVYSDHANQFVLVVDDFEKGKAVSDAWKAEMNL